MIPTGDFGASFITPHASVILPGLQGRRARVRIPLRRQAEPARSGPLGPG
jgi:hypothetical protein